MSAPRVALALALLAPAAARGADERLVTRVYRSDEVVRIEGRAGVQATVAFGAGEAIENVAVGDAEKWQITPNKRADLLFVKPLGETARTNMTVVTDRHTYFFDLVASPAARPIYMLRFTYADAPAPRPAAAAAIAAPAPAPPAEPANDPALLNFAWKHKGASALLPTRVYDDGSSTYLLWAAGQTVPAILVGDTPADERPAALAVRGNTVVLASVPRRIVLKLGRSQASLVNQNEPAPQPAPATTPPPPQAASAAG